MHDHIDPHSYDKHKDDCAAGGRHDPAEPDILRLMSAELREHGDLQGKHGDQCSGQIDRSCGRQRRAAVATDPHDVDHGHDRGEKRIQRHRIDERTGILKPLVLHQHEEHHRRQRQIHEHQRQTADVVTLPFPPQVAAKRMPMRIAQQQKPHECEKQIISRQRAEPHGMIPDPGKPVHPGIQQVDDQRAVQRYPHLERMIAEVTAKAAVLQRELTDPLNRRRGAGAHDDERISRKEICQISQRMRLIQYGEGDEQQRCGGRDAEQGHRRSREHDPAHDGLNPFHLSSCGSSP